MSFYRSSLLLLLLSSFFSGFSHDHFLFLPSEGDVPEVLKISPEERYDLDVKRLIAAGYDKNIAATHSFVSAFAVDEMVSHGFLIYGNDLVKNLNQFKDYALRNHPYEKTRIEVFVSMSKVQNAYCLSNGMVVVNLGLLAKAKSIEEVYSVLCHEFSHFILRHSVNQYQHVLEQIEKFTKSDSKDINDFFEEYFRYSRLNERQADSLGLMLFTQSGFSTSFAVEALESLKSSNYSLLEESEFHVGLIAPQFDPAIGKELVPVVKVKKSFKMRNDSFASHDDIDSRIRRIKQHNLEEKPNQFLAKIDASWKDNVSLQYVMNLLADGYIEAGFSSATFLVQNNIGAKTARLFQAIALSNALRVKVKNPKSLKIIQKKHGIYTTWLMNYNAEVIGHLIDQYLANMTFQAENLEIFRNQLIRENQWFINLAKKSNAESSFYESDTTGVQAFLSSIKKKSEITSPIPYKDNSAKKPLYVSKESAVSPYREYYWWNAQTESIDRIALTLPKIEIYSVKRSIKNNVTMNYEYRVKFKEMLVSKGFEKRGIQLITINEKAASMNASFTAKQIARESEIYPDYCFRLSSLNSSWTIEQLGAKYIAYVEIGTSNGFRVGFMDHLTTLGYPSGPFMAPNSTTISTRIYNLSQGRLEFKSDYGAPSGPYKDLFSAKVFSLLSIAKSFRK